MINGEFALDEKLATDYTRDLYARSKHPPTFRPSRVVVIYYLKGGGSLKCLAGRVLLKFEEENLEKYCPWNRWHGLKKP